MTTTLNDDDFDPPPPRRTPLFRRKRVYIPLGLLLAIVIAFLLLRTPEEFEQWERLKDQGEIGELPNFIPPEAQKPEAPKKKGFPEYPEGDLIARALRLAFVGGEGEGDDMESGS